MTYLLCTDVGWSKKHNTVPVGIHDNCGQMHTKLIFWKWCMCKDFLKEPAKTYLLSNYLRFNFSYKTSLIARFLFSSVRNSLIVYSLQHTLDAVNKVHLFYCDWMEEIKPCDCPWVYHNDFGRYDFLAKTYLLLNFFRWRSIYLLSRLMEILLHQYHYYHGRIKKN